MLTKEHLPLIVGYLPYGLKLRVEETREVSIEEWSMFDVDAVFRKRFECVDIKPVLKPMNTYDTDEFISMCKSKDVSKMLKVLSNSSLTDNGIVSLACEERQISYLYQNHYDIHNLIGQGLAVDTREVKE